MCRVSNVGPRRVETQDRAVLYLGPCGAVPWWRKKRKQRIISNFLWRQSFDLNLKIRFIRICSHIALKTCGSIVG